MDCPKYSECHWNGKSGDMGFANHEECRQDCILPGSIPAFVIGAGDSTPVEVLRQSAGAGDPIALLCARLYDDIKALIELER